MKKYFVYIHTNSINNKKYVGITKQTPERRWQNGYGYRKNKHFFRAIEKYGWDNFSHQVFEVDTESEMYYLEKYLISYYNATNPILGYNKSKGGEKGCLGVKMSAESRAKMSEIRKNKYNGEKNPLYGTGRHVLQLTLDGKVIKEWISAYEAERVGGFYNAHIYQCCRGIYKQHGGYIWKYAS